MSPTARSARVLAEEYVVQVNARDLDSLLALFAADAQVQHPLGSFTGYEEIRGFYVEHVLAHGPTVIATSWVEQGPDCVFEMEARLGDHVSYAIDRLTAAVDGHIQRLAIYYR
jgi:hypothetical protein